VGRLYISDHTNDYVTDPRLQVFSPEGVIQNVYTPMKELKDVAGNPVYLGAVAGLAINGDDIWLVDAAGRVYASHGGVRDGGEVYLGPGAAGRQFDLSTVDDTKFTLKAQDARVRHRYEGKLLGFASGENNTHNCERDGSATLKHGERSMWLPSRIGEPFTVSLVGEDGQPIVESGYSVEYEEKSGAFGSHYDFFRVTNHSGIDWSNVKYIAEAKE